MNGIFPCRSSPTGKLHEVCQHPEDFEESEAIIPELEQNRSLSVNNLLPVNSLNRSAKHGLRLRIMCTRDELCKHRIFLSGHDVRITVPHKNSCFLSFGADQ